MGKAEGGENFEEENLDFKKGGWENINLWGTLYTPVVEPTSLDNLLVHVQLVPKELRTKHRVCRCCRHATKKKSPFESCNNFKADDSFTIVTKLFF